MKQQVPLWAAVIAILIVVLIAGFLVVRGFQKPAEGPPAPFLQGQPAGPGAPPGQRPEMRTR